MNPVLAWLGKAGLRLVQPFTSARAIIKVLATADVFSLMLLRLLLIGIGLLSAPMCASAASPCHGQIGPETNITGATGYDPFSPTGIADTFQITISNPGDAECSYALAFRSEAPDPRLGGTLAYALTDGRTALLAAADALSSPLARTRLPVPPGGAARIDYQVQIPRGQFAAPGQYRDVVGLELYATSAGGELSGPPLQTATLTVTYTAVRAMSVNIKGGGTSTTMDFGTLSTGQRQSVEIQARSNEGYQLRVTSDNSGAMVLTPAVPGQDWRVDYAAVLDGERLNLTGGHGLSTQPPTRPESDASHVLTVIVGDTEQKRAGRYEDVITVEIRGAVP